MAKLVLDLGGVVLDVPTRLTMGEVQRLRAVGAMNKVPPVASFKLVARYVQRYETYIVSAVGDEQMEAETMEWLDTHEFWAATGIRRDQIYFCGTGKGEKIAVCRNTGIVPDVVVDDKPEILEEFRGALPHVMCVLFDRGEGEVALAGEHVVRTWQELIDLPYHDWQLFEE